MMMTGQRAMRIYIIFAKEGRPCSYIREIVFGNTRLTQSSQTEGMQEKVLLLLMRKRGSLFATDSAIFSNS